MPTKLEHYYDGAKGNKWLYYFAIFCRILLALGFLISGFVKINGERFASGLPVNNPMGHYLEALFHTEYYYTFIGISQLVIAALLLIPKTALLGALLYFPVILNISILAHAVRFEGTRVTMFMVLANLYLLCWDYDRIKYMARVLLKQGNTKGYSEKSRSLSGKFPFLFFGGVLAILAAVVIINLYLYDIRPGNSEEECRNGCPGNSNPNACSAFCDCIYDQGKPLGECLKAYEIANEKEEIMKTP